MATTITLSRSSGAADGYRNDLPLEHDLPEPIEVDATKLSICHPMFLVRLCVFVDWHRAAGRAVRMLPPRDPHVARHLSKMGLGSRGLARDGDHTHAHGHLGAVMLPIRRLRNADDVEDASGTAVEMLEEQTPDLAVWGGPVYMAVSELCGNAQQHGRHELGAYVAADRTRAELNSFRLAIADLGIGIPEHIRSRYPEWQDDTAAITRALDRGVTGTGDPMRGNGFAEVFDEALDKLLVRHQSMVEIDIRSAWGHVVVKLVDGRRHVNRRSVPRGRRGTWITYTVTSIPT